MFGNLRGNNIRMHCWVGRRESYRGGITHYKITASGSDNSRPSYQPLSLRKNLGATPSRYFQIQNAPLAHKLQITVGTSTHFYIKCRVVLCSHGSELLFQRTSKRRTRRSMESTQHCTLRREMWRRPK